MTAPSRATTSSCWRPSRRRRRPPSRTAKSVEADRRRRSLAAAEAERHRWARELHDETLQALGGLKVLLSSATRLDDPEAMRAAMREATQQLTGDIESLRALIAELRPPALDQLGLAPALTSLAQRTGAGNDVEVRAEVQLPDDRRLAPELETTVYRVVQESLTNVVKHAQRLLDRHRGALRRRRGGRVRGR